MPLLYHRWCWVIWKNPSGNWSIVLSLILLVIPVLAPRPMSFFSLKKKKSLAPVQSLQQVSLYAEPVKSLSNVSDQLSHAALLTQRLHHRVQLLEELCRRVDKRHSERGVTLSAAACAEGRHMNRAWTFFIIHNSFIHNLVFQHFP